MRVTPARLDHWLAWSAGFLLQAACTALVLKALPSLGLPVSYVLVYGLASAWLVLGLLSPRKARA